MLGKTCPLPGNNCPSLFVRNHDTGLSFSPLSALPKKCAEGKQPANGQTPARVNRFARILQIAVAILAMIFVLPHTVCGSESGSGRHTREYFRKKMAATVRHDHPAILPLAAAVRAITTNPLEQLAVVNDVTHLLVDYDDDERVWGVEEYHATFDEMLARRREGGWVYLRDDCDGRAVFAAHLLAALGITWRLEASFWKEHAWIIARVDGVDYDLLDLRPNAPETDRIAYKLVGQVFIRRSNRPPSFAWRRAWRDRTHCDVTLGRQLGILKFESTADDLHERFATDWTGKSPDEDFSPADDRARTPAFAAFPFGEAIRADAVANTAHTAKTARPIILPRGKTAASSPASSESVTRGKHRP